MMKIVRSKIGVNIRNYIELHKALEIDGVGRLLRSQCSSYLSQNKAYIHPSQESFKLEASEGGPDESFLNYLSEQLAISFSEAAERFKVFTAALVFDLEQKGTANVSGLGQFHLTGGSYAFTSEQTATGDFSYGLPTLKLKPLQAFRTEAQSRKTASTKRIVKDRSDRNFLMNTAATAALFLLMVYAYHQFQSPASQEITSVEIDSNRLNKKPEKVLVTADLESELIPGVVEEVEEVASCALIVGSFARKSNAVEMQQKVLAAGYELYMEEFEEFYRVGVSLDCSDVKGASFREIEAALGIDPWLRIAR